MNSLNGPVIDISIWKELMVLMHILLIRIRYVAM